MSTRLWYKNSRFDSWAEEKIFSLRHQFRGSDVRGNDVRGSDVRDDDVRASEPKAVSRQGADVPVTSFPVPKPPFLLTTEHDETDHELIKLNNKLFEAREEIEELQNNNGKLIIEKNKINGEVDNLRDLVKNMKGQMEYLERLKASGDPSNVQAELNSKKELERAKLEIDHLTRKVEMFSNIRKWNSELRRAHDKLSVEKAELSKRVEDLQMERDNIREMLSAKEMEVTKLELELKSAEESATEKSVLRDRVAAKEEKIRLLGLVLEKQSSTVEELTANVTSLNECFRNKEEFMNQEVEELKKSLEEKSKLIDQVENKLHDTELLVAELEALRDQFRTSNIALTESIKAYKKDIEGHVNNSLALKDTIKKLQSDNADKEKEIEKLMVFPQNPDTMLYFSQLNKLMTSVEKLELLTKDEQTDLLENVRNIIVKLKEEMWGGNITPVELQIQDSNIQTECDLTDRDIQCIPAVCSVLIQTAMPDEYMLKFKKSEEEVKSLSTRLVTFEKTLSVQAAELDSLETSLFDVIEDNHTKDMTLEKLARNNELLQETLITLNGELKNTDEMLMNAMNEIQQQSQSHKSSRDILENTLTNTVEEYSNYVAVLEVYLEQKDKQISEIKQVVERQELVHRELLERSAKEAGDLKELLRAEMNLTGELKTEVSHLSESLKEKSGLVLDMETKLVRAEKTIEKLIEDDGTEDTDDYPKDTSESDYVSSLGSQVASYKKQVAKYRCDIFQQRKICEILEDKVKALKRSKKYLKSAVSRSCVQKREAAVRLRKVRSCLTKSRIREKLLKMDFVKLDKSRSDLSESVDNLALENGVLKTERSVLLQEMYNLKQNLKDLEKCMEKHKERYTLHEELKMKMEKQVLKLMKKITKYKTALSVKRDEEENASRSYERAVISEKLNHEIDLLKTENMSLSTTICSLKQKLSSLFELPEKESSSVELQVSMEEQSSDALKENGNSSEDMSSHYEGIIAAMKKEHESAADQSHRQYMNNLKMLKDTYERDIAGMKKSHAENLEKMKTMQLEELEFLHKKQKKAELELEKSKIEEIFAKEAANLREHYEGCIRDKETHFENEKRKIVRETSAVRNNLLKQVENSVEEIEKMKVTFEQQVGKLEELQRAELELLKKRFEKRIDREIEQRMRKRRSRMKERETQCDSTEQEDRGTDPDIDVSTVDSCTNTDPCSIIQTISEVNCQERVSCEIKEDSSKTFLSMLPIDAEDFSRAPERTLLISRIEDLENRLRSHQTESARKLKLYEKRVKHEQMKAREIANILDQELRYSTDVHCKLGLQYNRAEQLELEKEMLASRLQLCEQELELIKNMKEDEQFQAITSTYEGGIVDLDRSLELEQSLNRLKQKIDQAEIHEQKLSDELQKSGEPKYECGVDHIPHKESSEVVRGDRASPDLKVIVIQQRKVTHSWSSQLDGY
ncbi:hypothetical protein GE061_006502 [Apolygus lucorum]|uniref:Uncharacterized protein n=1 Tax=Apolygus lucorum TaxID=248454 RepID=A0A8S9WTD4_APOLU|nr:hypothetical protein GE061_006502 [Apolygus lucorum]